MARLLRRGTAPPPADAGEAPLSLRERGAQTVRELGDVGARLHALRQRQGGGESLTIEEETLLAELDTRYRELEAEIRHLMRPREREPWIRGRDHSHGPDDPE